jgi:UDP-N-acetylglucosamine 2-epimerase (non-hydrolysing)
MLLAGASTFNAIMTVKQIDSFVRPQPYRLLLVVGARPNFVKIAPIVRALADHAGILVSRLVHTGQHYDQAMSDVFFGELAIPTPDVHLEVGSDTHARQTAAIMRAFEPVVTEWKPDMVLVVGDVNSTLACALVASKLGVKVAHVESGLRSFDRSMPEEINRLLTDQLSDLLFVSEESGLENLHREGIPGDRVHFVGNVMIDTLLAHRDRALALDMPGRLGLAPGQYGVITLHRPSNVDESAAFERLLDALGAIAADVPLVFPVHPRTRPALAESPVATDLMQRGRLRVLDPLAYLEFIGLVANSRVVLTDSGGIQEETTVLGVPCLTLRTSTERPVTISEGTNRLVGIDPEAIIAGWQAVKTGGHRGRIPRSWDGQAARRIVDVILDQIVASPTLATSSASLS